MSKQGRSKVQTIAKREPSVIAQPRFSKELYREIKIAAGSEGLAISGWIRRVCCLALEARKKSS